MRRIALALCVWLSCLLTPTLLFAQEPAVGSDPQAYLDQVASGMLQPTAGGLPFEVKAHFVASDESEHSGPGTYHQIWISPEKWRKEFTLDTYQLVLVRKGDTTYELTPKEFVPLSVNTFDELFLAKLCVCPEGPNQQKTELQQVKIGNINVIRVGSGKMSGSKIELPDHALYFSADHNALLMWTRGYEVITYKKYGVLAGKKVPLDFAESLGNKTMLDVQIDSLISNPPLDETLFTVPDSARPRASGTVTLSSAVISAKCLSCPGPRYPEYAKRQRIQGTVVLYAVVSRQGTVRDLTVLNSPDASLAGAAMEAVRTWRYSPTLIDGEPREVTTEIHVNFQMNR